MKGGNSTGIAGLLIVAAAAVLIFGGAGLFPGLTKALTVIIVIAVIGIAAVVAAVVYFAFRKPSEEKTVNKGHQISRGRRSLMELKNLNRKIQNNEIRTLNEEISAMTEKILAEVKNQDMDAAGLYQFFNYYLPTLESIVKKYISLEQSGSVNETILKNTVSCLGDIKQAMMKQYEGILEHKVLDLSVEMEALTLACRRDGLLSDDE